MNRIKRILLSAVIALGFSVPALIPAAAHAADSAQIGKNLNCGVEFKFDTNGCEAPTTGASNAEDLVVGVINIISVVVGIVAVIMIIVGGFKYITSSGDSNKVGSAKNTILYAIIGLVVVALSQVIVRFVLGKLSESVPTE